MATDALHPSSSHVQQAIEPYVREQLTKITGLTYESQRIEVGDSHVQIDAVGIDEQGRVRELVDIYARQGELKSAQKKKATDDAMRLNLARKQFGSDTKCRLVWCCNEAVDQIKRSWRGDALEALGVSIEATPIPDKKRQALIDAQVRQYR